MLDPTNSQITTDNVHATFLEELARIERSGITKPRKARKAFGDMADRFLRLFAIHLGEQCLPSSNQAQEFLLHSILSLETVRDDAEAESRIHAISGDILDYFTSYAQEIARPLAGLPGGLPISDSRPTCQ